MLTRSAPRLARAAMGAPLRATICAPRVAMQQRGYVDIPPQEPLKGKNDPINNNRTNTNLLIGGVLAVGAGVYWFMMEKAEDDGMKKVIQMTDKAETEEKQGRIVQAEHDANKGGVTSME